MLGRSKIIAPADYRELARRRVPHFLFEYPDEGSYAETTLGRNVQDLQAVWLRQRVLSDMSHIDLGTELFGQQLRLPVVFAWLRTNFDPSVTWRDLDFIRDRWTGPLLLKGILDVEDARRAASLGANGIVVSNHGGRQLDGVPSVARVLPRIADAVGSELTVLADGGVRSGLDVVRMLALGARMGLCLGSRRGARCRQSPENYRSGNASRDDTDRRIQHISNRPKGPDGRSGRLAVRLIHRRGHPP